MWDMAEDWIERPAQRLERLERSIAKGIEDQANLREDVRALRKSLEAIQGTLNTMASDEIADLKRKAELPRKLLLAITIPVLVAVITAVVLAALGSVHFA